MSCAGLTVRNTSGFLVTSKSKINTGTKTTKTKESKFKGKRENNVKTIQMFLSVLFLTVWTSTFNLCFRILTFFFSLNFNLVPE